MIWLRLHRLVLLNFQVACELGRILRGDRPPK